VLRKAYLKNISDGIKSGEPIAEGDKSNISIDFLTIFTINGVDNFLFEGEKRSLLKSMVSRRENG